MTKTSLKLGLIGDNIAASQAPRLHRTLGARHGIDVSYDRLVPREMGMEFHALFDWCRDQGFDGINVTYPYKEIVAEKVAARDHVIAALGAVNTVIFQDGAATGYNTDLTGFVAAYRTGRGQTSPGICTIIGTGGVGRALAFGLSELGAEELRLVDFNLVKAERLAEALSDYGSGSRLVVTGDVATAVDGAQGIVNATPVGMVGYEGSPVANEAFVGASWAFDAVYTPIDTRFLHDAQSNGLDIISGYELFFYQGVHAWKHFSGLEADEPAPAPSTCLARGRRMKTSIATVSISGNLREKLAAIAKVGFDGIEIFEQDFIADEGSPREIGQLVRDHGLEIMLFQPFRDFEGLTGVARARAFDRAKYKFDTMSELGTDLMLVCSTVHPEAVGGIDRAADDFAELGTIAAKQGIRIGYEALAWGRHVNDHRDAWEIVRRADHPSIGLIVDSFHTLARKIDPDTIRRIPGDKIFFVQLADAPRIDMDLLYWSRHFRNMPGEGDLQVQAFMQAVAATGYDGPISLEIFNDQFRGGHPESLARDGYRSLLSLMDDVRRAEPDVGIDVPEMPPRVRVNGVEFIEFTTRGQEAIALSDLLLTMGFTHVGDHVSKKVALWQQGDIRIVLNQETTGFASSAYTMHGTSVCDVGLMVEDATATTARALTLGASPFNQAVGPGELDIPAIRSVGGSVLHFIDEASGLSDVWSVEFRASQDQVNGGVGLDRVDHVAETMNYDEMLSWSLFYTSIFDMDRTPMVDVIDPDGLVRSQAIKALGGEARITLNGAETHRTVAGSFLAESFGGAVQHVAFATDNIFETASQMADLGFEPLPMTRNYYHDLGARFSLDAEFLERLRAMNILYDEDESGAFFQIYSKPILGGFFFEIVQRAESYDGYGAPNAPFRIAAQKRHMRPKGMPRE